MDIMIIFNQMLVMLFLLAAGVIAAKGIHMQSAKERKALPEQDELYIDIGYNKEEAEKRVSVGDVVTFVTPTREMAGGFITGKDKGKEGKVIKYVYEPCLVITPVSEAKTSAQIPDAAEELLLSLTKAKRRTEG